MSDKKKTQKNKRELNESPSYKDKKLKQGYSTDSSEGEQNDQEENMIYIITKKYQSFQIRPSFLDDYTEGSYLNRSRFKGFYNVALLFSAVLLLTNPIIRYQKTGQAFPYNLWDNFSIDFGLCISTWPLFYAWSYWALLHERLAIKNYPKLLLQIFKYTSYLVLYAYSCYMVTSRDWCTTHGAFVTFLSCVMSMKMYSYTEMNRLYREDWQRCKQSGNKDQKPQSPYPQNINFSNFTLFMWMPVIVYEYEYPRTEKIRISFIIRKSLLGLGAILAGYIIVGDFIMPQVAKGDQISPFELLFRIQLPLCMIIILIFFIVWECILNVFGEITRFGDRQFYQDWWNSTLYEEMNRKWNKPIYMFLLRHVYLQSIHQYKRSKRFAQIVTFLFSAVLHEWCISLIIRSLRPIMFIFMIQQIPLFYFTKNLQGKRSGNFLYWWGLIFGVALILTLYLRIDSNITHYFAKS